MLVDFFEVNGKNNGGMAQMTWWVVLLLVFAILAVATLIVMAVLFAFVKLLEVLIDCL